MKHRLFLTLALALVFSSTKAQNVFESLNDTAINRADQAPMEAAPIMKKKWNHFETKFFTLNFGVAVFLDYNVINQDANSIQQVGDISPATEFRAERVIVSGTLPFFTTPWRYMFSGNYNGLDQEDGKDVLSIIDLNLEIPFGKKGGWLTIGKQKEGVGHEYVSPGSLGMFTERGSGVPAFIKQRNLGIRYSNSIVKHRLAYTVGIFNNWIEKGNKNSFSENGIQATTRITGLPRYTSDRDLLHLGFGWRYTNAPNDLLSYKARPEANSAPYFISTGSFDASSANTMMLEAIGVRGPVTMVAEYMNTWVSSSAMGNPDFNYWTIGGSWFITGENRKYNKQTGNLGKPIPKKSFRFFKKGYGPGAIELGARYTKSNFIDGNIDGGKFGRFTGAFSWFPSVHFRFELNYAYGTLEKQNITGKANFWQFRWQFEL